MSLALDPKDWVLIDSENNACKHEKPLPTDLLAEVQNTYNIKVDNIKEFGVSPTKFTAGIVRCEPGYWYPPHADHESKIISSVLYLSPRDAPATIFVDEVDSPMWERNKLVCWKNNGEIHWYKNDTDYNRYTLNIYQRDKETRLVVETSRASNN